MEHLLPYSKDALSSSPSALDASPSQCGARAAMHAPYSTNIRAANLYASSAAAATNVPHAREINNAAPQPSDVMLVPRWLRFDPSSSGLAMVAGRRSPLQRTSGLRAASCPILCIDKLLASPSVRYIPPSVSESPSAPSGTRQIATSKGQARGWQPVAARLAKSALFFEGERPADL
jgi:hypothetical protein